MRPAGSCPDMKTDRKRSYKLQQPKVNRQTRHSGIATTSFRLQCAMHAAAKAQMLASCASNAMSRDV